MRGAGGEPIDFARTLRSHGCAELPPAFIPDDNSFYDIGLRLDGRVRRVTIAPRSSELQVSVAGARPGALLVVAGLGLAACSGGNGQSQATASPQASPSVSAPASPAATTAAGAATPAAIATPAPALNPTAAIHYSDIAGIFAETAIKQEAQLGVFGNATSGKFNPYGTVPRAEYVRWLVVANNIYFRTQPDKQIRLAEANSDSSFVDVPKSNTDFKYIQGMVNSGFVIGIDKKHFAPGRPLTREEMTAILMSRDANSSPLPNAGPPSTWNYSSGGGTLPVDFTDRGKVSKPYWGAFQLNDGYGNSYAVQQIKRIYGNTKIFYPQKTVTRGDTAVALQVIDQKSAATTLGL